MIHTDGKPTIAWADPPAKKKKRAVTLPLPPVPAGREPRPEYVVPDALTAIFKKHDRVH